jgi:predicted kinase
LREHDRECRLTRLTGHVNRSAVTLDYRFRYGQSQAAACAVGRACGVNFVEPLEHVRQMLRCDAAARVADRQRGDAVGLRCAQRDRAARRRMPKRIADEVLDRLFDAIGIGDDLVRVLLMARLFANENA